MFALPDETELSLAEQIAQMIVVRASGYSFDHQIRFPQWEPSNQELEHWIRDLKVGGVILLGGSAIEIAQRTHQLQTWSEIPLLMAADIEEGVGQRFSGATWFPPPMALGEIAKTDLSLGKEYARKMGEVTAQEALALGLNWVLAPVVDVNNNPDNPVINVRSFGESPEMVQELTQGFIAGAQTYPVLTTAKHFPGHGDTATDSHFKLPVIEVGTDRLEAIELPPFISAISQGVDAVMSAHLLVRCWDDTLPATLSSTILTQQLRLNLGFEGLIVTDALIMGALSEIASPEEIPILAIEAGADIILMPENPDRAIAAILEAVNNGRLSPQRISASVARIGKAKAKISHTERKDIRSELATPIALETTQNILRASLRTRGDLPIALPQTPSQNLVIVDDLLSCDFLDRTHRAIALPQQLGYELQLLGQAQVFPEPPKNAPQTLIQLFTRGNPFRGESGLNEETKAFLQALINQGGVQGVIVYGSPYVLTWLEVTLPETIPYVFSYGQMSDSSAIALQKLLGDLAFSKTQDQSFL
ncbi:glycoside hydrolase family 3 domain protein [Halothece sp. PCC 7418]|uniref:glycoside hydrolase family 3 N-terminal domain-containing protein n=1 Tax=Halothece sp. (strain PCC 7418) TaxID=65093 RepID=UPI0002A05AAA|nr:glycoside hydrolase family 3 N-terminal domain-containing protein [Halothece sp. PCC 7418]AFZ44170.1 glycoside hydrolase family 3 domain protein [Halothece sp. PCC 7418]